MRGVAHDPVFRAKLMAMHEQGVTFSALRAEFGVAREVLSRWWDRYEADDLAGLQPHSRRPHTSPTQITARLERQILPLRPRPLTPARIPHSMRVRHGPLQRLLHDHGV